MPVGNGSDFLLQAKKQPELLTLQVETTILIAVRVRVAYTYDTSLRTTSWLFEASIIFHISVCLILQICFLFYMQD